METHRLVLPEDLNQFGFLFGGRLLRWVDEASWIAASLDFPHCRFVTVGMDDVSFKKQINQGDIIVIQSEVEKKGNTSVGYRVRVYKGNDRQSSLFSTLVTFVNVDESGVKTPC
ncbi:acyl-CoA thioesterase [Akkermansiaceae bacterium]|nr:acyl-CoA thioesterase [Akkermansiaceae bacterium]